MKNYFPKPVTVKLSIFFLVAVAAIVIHSCKRDSQAITALAEWDNNSHTTKEYAEAMLYGLNNATDGPPAQQALLNTEYNS
jgi:hypothetical protein